MQANAISIQGIWRTLEIHKIDIHMKRIMIEQMISIDYQLGNIGREEHDENHKILKELFAKKISEKS